MVKLCIVAAILVACFAIQIGAEDVQEAWEKFQAHFPQNTNSETELTERFRNFAATHEAIEEHRKLNSTYEQDHNRFSVMSDDEIRSYMGGDLEVPAGTRYLTYDSPMERQAASIDYRKDKCMPAVKNQGKCGSCWAFAATAVVEFGKCVKNGGTKVSLSEQQLVDCSKQTSKGCGGGSFVGAFIYLSGNSKGQYTAASYPYKGVDGKCVSGVQGAAISSSTPVTSIKAGDVKTMIKLLNERRILSIGVKVVKSFAQYKSGVYDEPNCTTNILGGHAMALVGYGKLNNVDYWVIRNSWGSSWGAAGYMLFKRGSNTCMVESFAAATTVL